MCDRSARFVEIIFALNRTVETKQHRGIGEQTFGLDHVVAFAALAETAVVDAHECSLELSKAKMQATLHALRDRLLLQGIHPAQAAHSGLVERDHRGSLAKLR